MRSTGLSRSMPERSKPAFQSRRWRSTHRRPLSRSRRSSASRMCAVRLDQARDAAGIVGDDEGRGRPHQHAGGLLGQQQHAVVRGLGDQLVELGVELGDGGRISRHLARLVDVGGEAGQVLVGPVVHGLIDGGRLQRPRGMPQLAERHLLQDQRAGHARGEAVVVRHGHRQAPARLARDEARLLEQADALAHGRAVDAELLDELGFGADGIAGLQAAGQDLALDRLRHQLVGRPRLDALEPGGDLCHFARCDCPAAGRARRPSCSLRSCVRSYWLGASFERMSPNSSHVSPLKRASRTDWIG